MALTDSEGFALRYSAKDLSFKLNLYCHSNAISGDIKMHSSDERILKFILCLLSTALLDRDRLLPMIVRRHLPNLGSARIDFRKCTDKVIRFWMRIPAQVFNVHRGSSMIERMKRRKNEMVFEFDRSIRGGPMSLVTMIIRFSTRQIEGHELADVDKRFADNNPSIVSDSTESYCLLVPGLLHKLWRVTRHRRTLVSLGNSG